MPGQPGNAPKSPLRTYVNPRRNQVRTDDGTYEEVELFDGLHPGKVVREDVAFDIARSSNSDLRAIEEINAENYRNRASRKRPVRTPRAVNITFDHSARYLGSTAYSYIFLDEGEAIAQSDRRFEEDLELGADTLREEYPEVFGDRVFPSWIPDGAWIGYDNRTFSAYEHYNITGRTFQHTFQSPFMAYPKTLTVGLRNEIEFVPLPVSPYASYANYRIITVSDLPFDIDPGYPGSPFFPPSSPYSSLSEDYRFALRQATELLGRRTATDWDASSVSISYRNTPIDWIWHEMFRSTLPSPSNSSNRAAWQAIPFEEKPQAWLDMFVGMRTHPALFVWVLDASSWKNLTDLPAVLDLLLSKRIYTDFRIALFHAEFLTSLDADGLVGHLEDVASQHPKVAYCGQLELVNTPGSSTTEVSAASLNRIDDLIRDYYRLRRRDYDWSTEDRASILGSGNDPTERDEDRRAGYYY